MKKILSIVLALALLLTAMSFALAEELPTITIMFHGSNVTDDSAVLEAVNEYIADKVGAKLEVVWGTWGDFDDKATNALLSGDTGIDMVFTCSWSADEYNTYAKNGYFVKLDDLIAEYGADTMAKPFSLCCLINGSMMEKVLPEPGVPTTHVPRNGLTMFTHPLRNLPL